MEGIQACGCPKQGLANLESEIDVSQWSIWDAACLERIAQKILDYHETKNGVTINNPFTVREKQ